MVVVVVDLQHNENAGWLVESQKTGANLSQSIGGLAIMKKLLGVVTAALAFQFLGVAQGLAGTPQDLCKGQIEVIRLSTIIPGGTIAGFREAVAQRNAWYNSRHASANDQIVARVIRKGSSKSGYTTAGDEVVTLQTNPPPELKHDAAYNAFTKKFQANSKITMERTVCIPSRTE
jgi:hypothetical protein